MINEMITSIKLIKMYGWEASFAKTIKGIISLCFLGFWRPFVGLLIVEADDFMNESMDVEGNVLIKEERTEPRKRNY